MTERELEHKLENSLSTLHSLLAETKDKNKSAFNKWSTVIISSLNFQRFRNDKNHAIRAINQIPFQLPPNFDTQIYEDMVYLFPSCIL